MKSKWSLFSAIVQLVFGVLAIASVIIVAISGENMTRWIVALLSAIALVIIGIIGNDSALFCGCSVSCT